MPSLRWRRLCRAQSLYFSCWLVCCLLVPTNRIPASNHVRQLPNQVRMAHVMRKAMCDCLFAWLYLFRLVSFHPSQPISAPPNTPQQRHRHTMCCKQTPHGHDKIQLGTAGYNAKQSQTPDPMQCAPSHARLHFSVKSPTHPFIHPLLLTPRPFPPHFLSMVYMYVYVYVDVDVETTASKSKQKDKKVK